MAIGRSKWQYIIFLSQFAASLWLFSAGGTGRSGLGPKRHESGTQPTFITIAPKRSDRVFAMTPASSPPALLVCKPILAGTVNPFDTRYSAQACHEEGGKGSIPFERRSMDSLVSSRYDQLTAPKALGCRFPNESGRGCPLEFPRSVHRSIASLSQLLPRMVCFLRQN